MMLEHATLWHEDWGCIAWSCRHMSIFTLSMWHCRQPITQNFAWKSDIKITFTNYWQRIKLKCITCNWSHYFIHFVQPMKQLDMHYYQVPDTVQLRMKKSSPSHPRVRHIRHWKWQAPTVASRRQPCGFYPRNHILQSTSTQSQAQLTITNSYLGRQVNQCQSAKPI